MQKLTEDFSEVRNNPLFPNKTGGNKKLFALETKTTDIINKSFMQFVKILFSINKKDRKVFPNTFKAFTKFKIQLGIATVLVGIMLYGAIAVFSRFPNIRFSVAVIWVFLVCASLAFFAGLVPIIGNRFTDIKTSMNTDLFTIRVALDNALRSNGYGVYTTQSNFSNEDNTRNTELVAIPATMYRTASEVNGYWVNNGVRRIIIALNVTDGSDNWFEIDRVEVTLNTIYTNKDETRYVFMNRDTYEVDGKTYGMPFPTRMIINPDHPAPIVSIVKALSDGFFVSEDYANVYENPSFFKFTLVPLR